MVEFVYLDETETLVSRSGPPRRHFSVVALMVPEHQVRQLSQALASISDKHLGFRPADFEFHGYELWNAKGHWVGKTPTDILAVFQDLIGLLDRLDLKVAHSTIDKLSLVNRYGTDSLDNSYLLALQFLLEKIDRLPGKALRVLVADENVEHQLNAISMTSEMQMYVNSGIVAGRKIDSVVDSMHFVNSKHSAGVQLTDAVAFIINRSRLASQGHEEANTVVAELREVINARTPTWRAVWP